jgi:hypothetical protein
LLGELFSLFLHCLPFSCRFAYEFGAKCLFTNLPGNFSLINNYREKGENYAHTRGGYARLVNKIVIDTLNSYASLHNDSLFINSRQKSIDLSFIKFQKDQEVDLKELYVSLNYFPSFIELVNLQFDFNIRRLGSLSSLSPYPLVSYFPRSCYQEINFFLRHDDHQLEESGLSKTGMKKLSVFAAMRKILSFTDSLESVSLSSSLSFDHWLELKHVIESHLLPFSTILSVELNPLFFFFNYDYLITHNFQSMLYLSSPTNDSRHQNRSLCEDLFVDFSGFATKNDLDVLGLFKLEQCRWYCPLNENLFVRRSYDLIILPLNLIRSHSWKNLVSDFQSVEYLFIIGSCISAPPKVSLSWNEVDSTVDFVAIEEVCDSSFFKDVGGVLYR